MEIEDIIQKMWPRVRKKHLYPHLPMPKVIEGGEDVALELKSKQLTISSAFY